MGLDQRRAAIGRLRVPAGLVQRLDVAPQPGDVPLDGVRQAHPGVAAVVVARLRRLRERRIGERADHDDDVAGLGRLGAERRRAALRAEVEDALPSVRLVRDPREVAERARDPHLFGAEAGLHAERAARPSLAGQAVADRNGVRLARDLETELPAVARGFPGHGGER
jgi:hypothetical protein